MWYNPAYNLSINPAYNVGGGDPYNHSGAGSSDWSQYDGSNDKTPVTFASSATRTPKVAALGNTKFVVLYNNSSFYVVARVGEIDSSGNVTFGTETILYSGSTRNISVVSLTESLCVCAYRDLANGTSSSKAFTITGLNITTVGASSDFNNTFVSSTSVCKLSSSKFLIGFEDGNNNLATAIVGEILGTTITYGTKLTVGVVNPASLACCELSSNEAIVQQSVSGTITAYYLTISGTIITNQSALAVATGKSNVVLCSNIENRKAIIGYSGTFAQSVDARIVTSNGITATLGTEAELEGTSSNKGSFGLAIPDTGHVVCTYESGTPSVGIQTAVSEVSGITLNPLDTYTNVTGDKEDVASVAVGSGFVVIVYEDDDDSSYGKAIVLRP